MVLFVALPRDAVTVVALVNTSVGEHSRALVVVMVVVQPRYRQTLLEVSTLVIVAVLDVAAVMVIVPYWTRVIAEAANSTTRHCSVTVPVLAWVLRVTVTVVALVSVQRE